MQVYLVGGAVRDQLLNRPVKDKDWVVVGATPKELLDNGFQPVGKDFPVFLHPETHEEYALARTEKKQGSGYTGFECQFGQDITLEEDLSRRDLTINAMAQGQDGNIIDPFHGQTDLHNKTLRHVSDAFVEDPLRVLRVARFLARYHDLDFHIAQPTLDLMKAISKQGELNTLTPERVWLETEKALKENSPWRYFETLHDTHALTALFPELDQLFGVPQPAAHHPEIDTGIHVMMTLKACCTLLQDDNLIQDYSLNSDDRISILFALLCHDLGKGLTPQYELPHHRGHERISEHLADKLCTRLKTPSQTKRISKLVALYHTQCHTAFELKPNTMMRLLEALDVLRRPETLFMFLIACEADSRGRAGFEDRNYPQADYLKDCAKAARSVNASALTALGYKGKTLGIELRKRRINAIRDIKNSYVRE